MPFQSLFSWTLLQLDASTQETGHTVICFNPCFPRLSCNKPFLRKKSFTKRTSFLLRKEYQYFYKRGKYRKPRRGFLIVSILVFVDLFATGNHWLVQVATVQSFNPCFRRPFCNLARCAHSAFGLNSFNPCFRRPFCNGMRCEECENGMWFQSLFS